MKDFIHAPLRLQHENLLCLCAVAGKLGEIFIKSLAMFGNGRAAPTPPTPVIARCRARSANTMASLCGTNTFFGAGSSLLSAVTFALPIVTFFRPRSAGHLPAF